MKELVLHIAKGLAGHPEQVRATESTEDGVLQIRLTVSEEDKGRIIGKQGKVIKAIRTVVQAAASAENLRTMVEVD